MRMSNTQIKAPGGVEFDLASIGNWLTEHPWLVLFFVLVLFLFWIFQKDGFAIRYLEYRNRKREIESQKVSELQTLLPLIRKRVLPSQPQLPFDDERRRKVTFALLVAFVAVGIGMALSRYLVVLDRSYRAADHVRSDLADRMREFLDTDVPSSVAQLAVVLGITAGCGCYVRGFILQHYAPFIGLRGSGSEDSLASEGFVQLEKLSPELRERFMELAAICFVYDSYLNPLQGLIFRRLIRVSTELRKPVQPTFRQSLKPRDRLEVQMTAMSVLSRKEPRDLIAA